MQKYSPVAQMTFPGYICTTPPAASNKVRVLALSRKDIKVQACHMVIDLPVVSLFLPDQKFVNRRDLSPASWFHGGAHEPQRADLSAIREIVSSLSQSGDINLDATKYRRIPTESKELYESWLELTSSHGLDLLPTGPTSKSFGKFKVKGGTAGEHHISTLDQVYVSESIPATAYLNPMRSLTTSL